MTTYKFVESIEELIESLNEFSSKPALWKDAIGNAPKYFLYINKNGKSKFGLSKFCAFKNITLEDYIDKYRYKTDGGTTQKHISICTGKKWLTYDRISDDIKKDFDIWIASFFPSYNKSNASFIFL